MILNVLFLSPLNDICDYDSSFTRSWRVVDTNYFDTVCTYNIFLKSKIMKATTVYE